MTTQLIHDTEVTSVVFDGVTYEADADGRVDVPDDVAAALEQQPGWHLYVPVPDENTEGLIRTATGEGPGWHPGQPTQPGEDIVHVDKGKKKADEPFVDPHDATAEPAPGSTADITAPAPERPETATAVATEDGVTKIPQARKK